MSEARAKQHSLKRLKRELIFLERAYARQNRSAIIVLEGWDAAGKGGLIRRINAVLDPRHFRVWPIGAPTPDERAQHWLQRFWQRVPAAGDIALFDRSWYGRVLVERIEGFVSEAEGQRAYDEINAFEYSLAASGMRIVKLFLDIDADTQLSRFLARYDDPAKRWKLTAEDIRNRARRAEYERAYTDMIERCSSAHAPWVRIDANHKRAARAAAMHEIVAALGRDVDTRVAASDPEVEAFIAEVRGR